MPEENIYNIVTIRNIDNEDFVFRVDRVEYMIPKGGLRNFPKFMARLAVKHLTDKILLKEDPEGKLLQNDRKRSEIAAKIVVEEHSYEKPVVPTDQEIVDTINRPTDLDIALKANKERMKDEENLIEPPAPEPNITVGDPEPPYVGDMEFNTTGDSIPETSDGTTEEVFEGLKLTPNTADGTLPSRAKMLGYAKNTLGIDFETIIKAPGKNKGKSIKDVYASMSDEELYNEFQLEGVEL